jgi:hypothetical protein
MHKAKNIKEGSQVYSNFYIFHSFFQHQHRTETTKVGGASDFDIDTDIDTDVDGFGYKLREKSPFSSYSFSTSSNLPSKSTKLKKSLSVTSKRYGFRYTLDEFLDQSSFSENQRKQQHENEQNQAKKQQQPQNQLTAVKIRVKRVVKGDQGLENTLVIAWVGLSSDELNKCGTPLRLWDTRIFILGVESDGRMMIRIPPLPVTLSHLRLVNRLSIQIPGKVNKIVAT